METVELIKVLGEKLDVELTVDSDGTCAFEADGMVVSIHDLRELSAVALVGDLGEPPPERLEALYKAMMESNYLFSGTAGATISRNPATGRFALCQAWSCSTLDGDSFYAAVERFLNTLEVWGRMVHNYRSGNSSSDEAAEAPDLDGGFLRV